MSSANTTQKIGKLSAQSWKQLQLNSPTYLQDFTYFNVWHLPIRWLLTETQDKLTEQKPGTIP